jgi:hypothetical protein
LRHRLRLEQDPDLHVVIEGASHATMIVELPDTAACAHRRPRRSPAGQSGLKMLRFWRRSSIAFYEDGVACVVRLSRITLLL